MKQKNKIFSALMLLVVSALSLFMASYAWLTMAASVSTEVPEFRASAPNNLEISNDKAHWSQYITVNLGTANELRIMPASSYSGVNGTLFYTDKVNNGVPDSTTEFSVATKEVTKNSEGYYLDVPLYIRTTGAQDVKVALDILSDQTFVKDIVDGQVVEDKSISKSVRIAFLNKDKNGNSLGQDALQNPFVYNSDTDFPGTDGKIISELKDDGTAEKKTPVYLQDLYKNANNTYTQILDIKGSDSNPDTYKDGTPFIARIWIEGEDPNCVFTNGGKSFAISLKFIAID